MRNARVLVVDDEEGSRAFLLRAISTLEHTGVGAESAEAACELLTQHEFDMIFVDIVLPGASGLEAIGKFRALSSAPVYVVTGGGDDGLARDVGLLGGAGYLPKPVDPLELALLLGRLPGR